MVTKFSGPRLIAVIIRKMCCHAIMQVIYIPRVTSRQCFIANDVILSNFETELITRAN